MSWSRNGLCRKVYSVGIAFELQQFNLNVFKECLILQKRNQAFHCCKNRTMIKRWFCVGIGWERAFTKQWI